VLCSPEPENKAEYGQAYYNPQRFSSMKVGYVHPYHTEGSPIYMNTAYLMKILFSAVGPEQVSPHYETLSRSRRGVIFMAAYVGSIVAISRMGGWEHNNMLRGMIWHHEFLIALYLGNIELRHFTYLVGPKFSVFYNVYSRYEYQQFVQGWADNVELIQSRFLRHTKQQIEYNRVDKEYEFVKKRALINFLTNSKLNAEVNFHNRTVSMLSQIQNFEQANLKSEMRNIVQGSLDTVLNYVADPSHSEEIKRASFESALAGIRSGMMTYEGDKILPMIESEIQSRLQKFEGMSAEEEAAMLSLTNEQRRSLIDNDRKLKNEFLCAAPQIGHGAVKMNEKYKSYVQMAQAASR